MCIKRSISRGAGGGAAGVSPSTPPPSLHPQGGLVFDEAGRGLCHLFSFKSCSRHAGLRQVQGVVMETVACMSERGEGAKELRMSESPGD